MRRKELTGLRLYDLDLERGTVMIREGKGKKDCLLPLGARAAAWLDKYLAEARPRLVVEPDGREVFLCVSGKGLTPGVLGNLVHAHVKASGVAKTGSCHLFRHAMATLMLENGADPRYVQQMLPQILGRIVRVLDGDALHVDAPESVALDRRPNRFRASPVSDKH